jgi:hypothetical protein
LGLTHSKEKKVIFQPINLIAANQNPPSMKIEKKQLKVDCKVHFCIFSLAIKKPHCCQKRKLNNPVLWLNECGYESYEAGK